MNKLNSILSRILEIDEASIKDSLTPADVAAWDSLNALILVSELERAFNVNFTLDEIQGVKCIGDIKKCLTKRGVPLE